MICGYLPFDEESKSVLYKKILSCDYSIPSHVSNLAVDLIRKIFVRNPEKRYTIEDIKNHSWFNLFKPNQVRTGLYENQSEVKIDKMLVRVSSIMMSAP